MTEDNKTIVYIYSGIKVLYEENNTGSANYIYVITGLVAKRTTMTHYMH